jgi:hypothetical protein
VKRLDCCSDQAKRRALGVRDSPAAVGAGRPGARAAQYAADAVLRSVLASFAVFVFGVEGCATARLLLQVQCLDGAPGPHAGQRTRVLCLPMTWHACHCPFCTAADSAL